ncbi:ABC transporter substrate-binding protein, partial [Bifidobacterium longum]
PDIVDGGNSILYGLAKAGALLDVSKQAPDAEKDYYEGAWKSVTMQGNGVEKGAYGLPWYVNDGPTYWNTELMTAAQKIGQVLYAQQLLDKVVALGFCLFSHLMPPFRCLRWC